MQALWQQLPPEFQLHVGVFDRFHQHRESYPVQYRYHVHRPDSVENAWVRDLPGLLAGTGCVLDRPGSGWPLAFLAPRVQHFHDLGLPVDAVGVAVEPLAAPERRILFRNHFLPIRSWTVRDHSSAEALLEMGIDPARISIGADWPWLFRISDSYDNWAANLLQSLGLDLDRPILAVNISWPSHANRAALSESLARVLDRLHLERDLQVAFGCLDSRHPGFHRSCAEETQFFMTAPSVLIPNEYYSPAEWIALLRHCHCTLSPHYPFGLAAILAGTAPVFMGSRPAGTELCEDLGFHACTAYASCDPDRLYYGVNRTLANREAIVASYPALREKYVTRARRNLDLVHLFHGITSSPGLAKTAAR